MSKSIFNISASADRHVDIDIFGHIGESWFGEGNTVTTISERLNALNAIDADSIVVHINSLGGDLNQGLAIYEALKRFGDKLTTEMTGCCASAATIIAMAGAKRKMSKYGLMLIHKCWSNLSANENVLEEELESQRKFNDSMAKIYADATGLSVEDVAELMNENNGNGRWLSYDEAKEKGLVTGTLDSSKNDIATAAEVACYGLPELPDGYMSAEEERLLPSIKMIITKLTKMAKNNTPTQAELDNVIAERDAAIAERDALQAQLDDANNAKDAAEKKAEELAAEKAELEERNAELQDLLSRQPAAGSAVNGKDPEPNPDSFEARMANNPYYRQIAEEIGQTL